MRTVDADAALSPKRAALRRFATMARMCLIAFAWRAHSRYRLALVANREIGWLDATRVADIRRSRRAIRDILVTILSQGVERHVFDPPQVEGRGDLKAIAMALLDQCTHISMWYGPGGDLGEEQMAKLYVEMALRAVGAKPQA